MHTRTILLFLILSVGRCLASSDDIAVARRIVPIVPSDGAAGDACTANAGSRQCSSDCARLLVCSGGVEKPVAALNCTASKPYCSAGRCVAEEPSTCVGSVVEGVCPAGESGYYPAASSCYTYYYCNDANQAIEKYTCPVGFPYDLASGNCNRSVACGVVNCAAAALQRRLYAVNPVFPRLGALCDSGKIIPGTYQACEPSYELDDSLGCAFKCRASGNFPMDGEPTKYYRCLPSGYYGTFELTIMNCPAGQRFDAGTSRCVINPDSQSSSSTTVAG